MKITQHQNLSQITYLPNLFPINCYIWETDDALIVIDMGVRGFVKVVQRITE